MSKATIHNRYGVQVCAWQARPRGDTDHVFPRSLRSVSSAANSDLVQMLLAAGNRAMYQAVVISRTCLLSIDAAAGPAAAGCYGEQLLAAS